MGARSGAPQALKRPKDLTPRQWRAAQFLAEIPPAYDDLLEAARKLDMPYKTLWNWTKQPAFVQAMADAARRNVVFFLPKIYSRLADQALSGKAHATQMFLTHFDGYTEKRSTNLEAAQGAQVRIEFGREELSADERRRIGELTVNDGETPTTMASLGIDTPEPEPEEDDGPDSTAEVDEIPEPIGETD